MSFRKCTGCQKWYDASIGGCVNASCSMADRARVASVVTTPVHPQTKSPMVRGVLAPVKKAPPTVPKPVRALPETTLPDASAGVPTPVAVAEKSEPALLDTELYALEAGHHVVYRGDTRSPASLKGFGGFSAWSELDIDGARQVVRRGLGQNFVIKLPTKAKRLEDLFNSKNCQSLTLLTLARQIKLEKAGDTFHISTDPSDQCGGYTSGYIYGIRFKTMYLVDKLGRAGPCSFDSISRVNTKMVLDAQTLDAANTVAIAIDPDEVAFLTTIPIAQIYKYKEPNGKVWYKMPA